MQLRWEQLDPHIAATVQNAPVVTRERQPAALTDERTRTRRPSRRVTNGQITRRQNEDAYDPLEAVYSFLALAVALLVVTLYMAVTIHWSGTAPLVVLTILGLAVALSLCWPGLLIASPREIAEQGAASPAWRAAPRGRIAADRLEQALGHVALNRTERLYSEIVLLLLHESEQAGRLRRGRYQESLPPRVAQSLLQDSNDLLKAHRRLASRKHHASRLWNDGAALAPLEAERDALIARRDNEPDRIAARSLDRSVMLCDERINGVRALRPLVARLEAHQEMIYQALSLAHAALVRAQAQPDALHAPDIAPLHQTARRLTHQAQAVEEAFSDLEPAGLNDFGLVSFADA